MFGTDPEVDKQARKVKAALYTMMNGPVSTAMRKRGLSYKVNFGVELPRLKEFAETLPHTHALAARLWKEDIRECRILAGLLQPIESYSPELAEVWIDTMRFPEEAECTTMHLFSRMPEASVCAFRWIASSRPIYEQCGYILLGRLFMQGSSLSERDAEEYLDQTATALRSPETAVRLAAQKALMKYMDLGESEEKRGEQILEAVS